MTDNTQTSEFSDGPLTTPEINQSSAIPAEELERLTGDIIAAMKTVFDPEIPVDIYELGLIYKVDIEDDRTVKIDMTLTAPGCPVAGEMPIWVENAVSSVPGVGTVQVDMTFDPPMGSKSHVRRSSRCIELLLRFESAYNVWHLDCVEVPMEGAKWPQDFRYYR